MTEKQWVELKGMNPTQQKENKPWNFFHEEFFFLIIHKKKNNRTIFYEDRPDIIRIKLRFFFFFFAAPQGWGNLYKQITTLAFA